MTPATRAGDPNILILEAMVKALGELSDAMVFIGGCATGLLVTSVQAQPIRVTEDVDVVVQVASTREYHAIESALRQRGFTKDLAEDALICRWRYGSLRLDLMPAAAGILGFHNRWHPYAVESARAVTLPSGASIKLVTAPAFVATKLEAFKGRGGGDYLVSHDLEDIISIIDGRVSLLDEVRATPDALRKYLAEEIQALAGMQDFLDALPGHLPGDAASQAKLPRLIEKINLLSKIDQS